MNRPINLPLRRSLSWVLAIAFAVSTPIVAVAQNGPPAGSVAAAAQDRSTSSPVSDIAQGASPAIPIDLVAQGAAQPSPCFGQPAETAVTFTDPNLAAAVRAALTLDSSAPLSCGAVSGLVDLEATGAGISRLAGIESLSGLTSLDLGDNQITDVTPLAALTGLSDLWLGTNSIQDVTPLAGLTKLEYLGLRDNQVSDISALRGLTRMKDLDITYNSISDISPLSDMTEMEVLRVYNNPLTDIGAMRGLTRMTELHVHDLTELSDISPLIENAGLGEGDRVYVYNSAVTCNDARALEDKGVSVGADCFLGAPLEWWGIGTALAAGAAVFVVLRGLRLRRRESWA